MVADHYKTTGSGKKKRRTRVNTHFAKTSGILQTSDQTAVYVPNMRKRNCALNSKLGVTVAAEFKASYERARELFYRANTRDRHQDKSSSFELPPMQDYLRCEWADDGEEDPWYANGCCMAMSIVTCTATCWFMQMRKITCEAGHEFAKTVYAFQ